MSVRVVARVRPLLKSEIEKDQIVRIQNGADDKPSIVKIPNPKSMAEEYSFQFNSVYDQDSTQQQLFDAEVSPTVKHLFQGYDVTIFAYGSTGTGKTHTMRGGKSLVDRGMIPRLLSSIYRKSKAIEKSSDGETTVSVAMSYYEIYNDRVFDLFEAPEKRTATGLPIREAEGGKTVVVGLTEMPCGTLKEFELLYDKANGNRSTGATKLNAHSSRSHAILCVKVTITNATETRVSTASAIDLAGSEDNRRTGNGKDRMVESASINKSLFVLAQCVEAISKKQQRIPYRESKMTRILSLGQNNGFTVMILNLAPVKAFHLDTLSSLNFANRTKKIEVREIENEPIFKGPARPVVNIASSNAQRQPLRPLANSININLAANRDIKVDKPAKLFSVYSDRNKPSVQVKSTLQRSSPLKRGTDTSFSASSRPTKQIRQPTSTIHRPETMSKATIEALVERKVSEVLAAKALDAPEPAPTKDISSEVQARLDSIEKRLEGQEGERAEGLSYLFMAKQHQARGEDFSALKMYELARPYFVGNEKLEKKIERLRGKLADRKRQEMEERISEEPQQRSKSRKHEQLHDQEDESYHDNNDEDNYQEEDEAAYSDNSDLPRKSRNKHNKCVKPQKTRMKNNRTPSPDPLQKSTYVDHTSGQPPTPRTKTLLSILNTRDVQRMKALNGLGSKRAEAIVEFLNDRRIGDDDSNDYGGDDDNDCDNGVERLRDWNDVLGLDVRGIGRRTWEALREGVVVGV